MPQKKQENELDLETQLEKQTCGGAATDRRRFRPCCPQLDGVSQPKVTGAKEGCLSLPHMHKSRIDFTESDIQAVKCGFLPSMSAMSLSCIKLFRGLSILYERK